MPEKISPNKMKESYLKKIIILLFLSLLFLHQPLSIKKAEAANANLKEKIIQLSAKFEQSLGQAHLYRRIVAYLWSHQAAEKTAELTLHQSVVLFVGELIISLLCLHAAINLLVYIKPISAQGYLWFLFIWHTASFLLLVFFRISWIVLDFLVIRLRPDLSEIITEHFPFVFIVAAVLIYIWLLARTFSLDFWGALKICAATHLIYGSIIFMIITAANFLHAETFQIVVRENWGLQEVVSNYMQDVAKVTQGKNLLSLVRLKTFHL